MVISRTSPPSSLVSTDVERKEQEVANFDEFPPEVLIKHPLQNTWTLWYYDPDRSKTWEENQKEITSFDTVEDFWSLYNHIKAASDLKLGSDYSMFKNGIRPMWEDNANKAGGRWILHLDKKQRTVELDHFWLETLLCMIGEDFNEHSNEVCGAVVNVRPKVHKLAVWTSDFSSENSIMNIGRKLKERWGIVPDTKLKYQTHKDISSKSGNTKCIYSV